MVRNDDAAFSDNSSYLLYLFLQVGGEKSLHKAGFENSEEIIVRILLSIMTNGKRKVRLGVDIFRQKNLDSCKYTMDIVLQNHASSTAIFSLLKNILKK